MTIALTKHHGLGNDFLVTFDISPDEGAAAAVAWCDRRRGLGADGLLIGVEHDGGDVQMVLYNADGSRAEMSGNGIRCFAHAVALRRSDPDGAPDVLLILTDAGERRVELRPTGRADTIDATVDMGRVSHVAEPTGWADLGCNPDRPVAHLSLGNPHSVVGVEDVRVVELAALGAQVPDVNLEIVEPGPEPHSITMRVHERGVGVTDACGTGACAAAFAARSWGLVAQAPEVVVHMDGGSALVAFDDADPSRVRLTGPATLIAQIEVVGR